MNVKNKNATIQTGIYLALLSSFIFAFVPNFVILSAESGASPFFLLFPRFAIVVLVLIPILRWSKESPLQMIK